MRMQWANAACVILMIGSVATAGAGDWPAFRGPNGDGVSEETNLPVEWGPGHNVKWKAPLPAPGNSSPIVVGGNVFITCAEDQGRKRHLFCLSRQDGSQKWVRTIDYADVEETHKTNPYESATPVSDGTIVVVRDGSAGMHCYDLGGEPLWSRDLGEFRHIWGYGSSPILHDGKVTESRSA